MRTPILVRALLYSALLLGAAAGGMTPGQTVGSAKGALFFHTSAEKREQYLDQTLIIISLAVLRVVVEYIHIRRRTQLFFCIFSVTSAPDTANCDNVLIVARASTTFACARRAAESTRYSHALHVSERRHVLHVPERHLLWCMALPCC